MNSSTNQAPGKTVDLQGVAAFASLVELLAQELGTAVTKMQGQMPSGPDTFDKLLAEIEINKQGFNRKLTLMSYPGAPFTLRFQSAWSKAEGNAAAASAIASEYYINSPVASIIPQGRALARHIEDIFMIMDRMVTLGHSSKLSHMSIPVSQMEAFEQSESENLVTQYDANRSE
jgi:hypothetical protein